MDCSNGNISFQSAGVRTLNSTNQSNPCGGVISLDIRVNPYPPWVVIFLWLLTIVFSVGTILGNLLVLVAFKLERNIRRQLSNKFIVSLAITDLIIGMEGFPMLTVYVVGRENWPLGELLCQLWLFLDYTLCLVSILNVLLITVDRYGSVCYPAKYRVWQTRSRVRVFIFGSWIVPCVLFGLMIFAWEVMTGEGMKEEGKCYAPFLNDPYVNMAMYIIYYWTTLVAMAVLYRGIHTAAKTLEDKSKARERQTIALLLGQRCMAQVGVGMIMHSSASDDDENMESFFHAPTTIDDGGYVTGGEFPTNDPSSLQQSALAKGYQELATDEPTAVAGSPPNQAWSPTDPAAPPKPSNPRAMVPRDPLVEIPACWKRPPPQHMHTLTMTPPDSTRLRAGYEELIDQGGTTPVTDEPRMLAPIAKHILYGEFGQGEDEEEDEDENEFCTVPLIESVSSMPLATNSIAPAPGLSFSPTRVKLFTYASPVRRSTSLRRILAPVQSYGGVATLAAKPRRTRLIGSLSFDEASIVRKLAAPGSRKVSVMVPAQDDAHTTAHSKRPSKRVPSNGISHKSTCSLDYYYDSQRGSSKSLYADTSLNSIFDMGTSMTSINDAPWASANSRRLDPTEEVDSSTKNCVRAPEEHLLSFADDQTPRGTPARLSRASQELLPQQPPPVLPAVALPDSSTFSSLNSITEDTSSSWTTPSSAKSPATPLDEQPTPAVPSAAPAGVPLLNLLPISARRTSIQIKISPDTELLTPIIEEEKSTWSGRGVEAAALSPDDSANGGRRRSSAVAPSSSVDRGRQGTKRHRNDQKVVHLTVPGAAGGGGNGGGSRGGFFGGKKNAQNKKNNKGGRFGGAKPNKRENNWNRASWQSTTSSIYADDYDPPPKSGISNRRRYGESSHNIDEDEDSGASGVNRDLDEATTRPGSSADFYDHQMAGGGAAEAGGDNRKGSHWLVNLFNNPTSILNRKRKVTKAERRARKAFRTITVIVGTFALFWSPYYIVATIYGFCPDCVPAPLFLTSYYLCYLNSSVNPFAYAFANRLFRKTFIRILKGDLRRT